MKSASTVVDAIKFARFAARRRFTSLDISPEPHFDPEVKAEFLKRISESRGYLEFGAGGSTCCAAQRGVRTVSVEADAVFAAAVRQYLPSAAPVDVLDVNLGVTGEWSYPLFKTPTPKRIQRWRKYVDAPFEHLKQAGWFPDFVLVDGRFRRACALRTAREESLLQVPVTMLVDDYFTAGREHYAAIERWLGAPARIGRGACFHVRPATTLRIPTEEDIESAIRDCR